MPTRVMIMGLGPIGAGVARQLAARKNFKIVSAVDIDPAKAGKDVGEVVGLGKKTAGQGRGRPRGGDPEDEAGGRGPLHELVPQEGVAPDRGGAEAQGPDRLDHRGAVLPLVLQQARLAQKIDALAKKAKVAVVGTGVNPGFAMDALPITLTGDLRAGGRVRVDRVQDARIRRLPFQQKIGSGLTPEQFAEKVKTLHRAPRRADRIGGDDCRRDGLEARPHHRRDPAEDRRRPRSRAIPEVDPGYVCGIIQDGIGYGKGKPVITLHMEAYLGRAGDLRSRARSRARPSSTSRRPAASTATSPPHSITVNSIPKVLAAPPGLHTMRSLALPSFAGGK